MLKTIVIDPGHGGTDSGAAGNGLLEKDVNLSLAQLVTAQLAPFDVQIKLTRMTDTFISLTNRTDYANRLGADFFCSLHTNAGGGTGFESYIHTSASRRSITAGEVIHNRLAAFYKQHNFADRGLKTANFAVLRETRIPAVLLENLFIDNSRDAAALKDTAFLQNLAGAIATGLVSALDLPRKAGQPTPSPTVKPTPMPTATPTPIPHWARAAFDFLKKQGLVTEEHNLDSPVSWGEFSVVLKRLWDKLK
ncbi:MAG: N-acetylmuramoyl-L-alanine amidase [Clostridia bacterium]|nr:N-acetylmuramoyl-L-alanine amidase [Clostridia bacterium]